MMPPSTPVVEALMLSTFQPALISVWMAWTRRVAWVGRAGADLAQDAPVLQIGVGSFAGCAQSRVGPVDGFLTNIADDPEQEGLWAYASDVENLRREFEEDTRLHWDESG
jgi:hypothetical protein